MRLPKFPGLSFSFRRILSIPAFFSLSSPAETGGDNWWMARTKRERVLLSLFGAAVAGAGLYLLVLEGQLDQFSTLSTELPVSKQQLESAKRRIQNRQGLEQELEASRNKYRDVISAYPAALSSGSMAVLIGEAAKASKVTIKYFVPQPKLDLPDSKGKLIAEIPVDIVAEGTFDALVDFSSRLETLRGGALVRNFAITWETRDKDNKGKGSDGKKESGNVLSELIDSVVNTLSKSPNGDAAGQQKSVNNMTARLPRAEYRPGNKEKPPTTTINAAYRVCFFEVGAGGGPDVVDLSQYRVGRPNPFEPHVWDQANPWLGELPELSPPVTEPPGLNPGGTP
ncbi:hypothetical protein HM1_0255 [Heliomicrobium modesticaldum Ice1]|uniref:Uncharacterized protein n=1 Tax=Heliobacterium modesticaldum (strain ATCC 51547 / Ice1) TaxID=498761 RepID=B0TEF5_HELMI|nr:type II secretion system protein GspM [Heliomicrobium modesticaldum]ABZ82874.1 hypothetical protein HM1_0255 [Heliomicrobium modesticaldum Ice1]